MALLNCCTLLGWLNFDGKFGGQLFSSLINVHFSIQFELLVSFFLMVPIISVFCIRAMAVFDAFFIAVLIVASI